jgi:hypothetical protein
MPVALLSALVVAGSGLVGVAAAASSSAVFVQVPSHPSIAGHVHISFHPRARLPRGGYYYAVIVLVHYAGGSPGTPLRCATSSDMQETEYGSPLPGLPVRLTLLPAKSTVNQWCAGGSYEGAIYAVPHRPPCRSSYPCYGKSTQNGACWGLEGHVACGVVAKPEPEPKPPQPQPEPKQTPEPGPPATNPPPTPTPYSYPGGLPKPVDHSTRVIGRFQVSF